MALPSNLDKRTTLGNSIKIERSLLPPWRLLIGFALQDHGGGGSGGGKW